MGDVIMIYYDDVRGMIRMIRWDHFKWDHVRGMLCQQTYSKNRTQPESLNTAYVQVVNITYVVGHANKYLKQTPQPGQRKTPVNPGHPLPLLLDRLPRAVHHESSSLTCLELMEVMVCFFLLIDFNRVISCRQSTGYPLVN